MAADMGFSVTSLTNSVRDRFEIVNKAFTIQKDEACLTIISFILAMISSPPY